MVSVEPSYEKIVFLNLPPRLPPPHLRMLISKNRDHESRQQSLFSIRLIFRGVQTEIERRNLGLGCDEQV